MSIQAGQPIKASDFINESAGADDEGKSVKLDPEGKLDFSLLSPNPVGAFEAGEDISKGDALFLSLNEKARTSFNTTYSTSLGEMPNNTYYKSNTWTTPSKKSKINNITIYIYRSGGSSGGTNFGTFQILIRAVDGSNNPTGADLFTSDLIQIHTYGQQDGELDIPFSTPAELNPNTNYAFIIKYITTDTDKWAIMGGGTPTGYVKGNASSDGSTWSNLNAAFYLKIESTFGDVGKVYKTSALYPQSSKFFGFALKDALATETCYVGKGRCPFFSGLTVGSYYYLSDTDGAISSSAGTIPKKIGIASLATEIFSGSRPKLSNSTVSLSANEPIPYDGMCYVEQTTNSAVSIVLKDEDGNTVRTIAWKTVDSDKMCIWIPVNAGYSINYASVLTPIDYV